MAQESKLLCHFDNHVDIMLLVHWLPFSRLSQINCFIVVLFDFDSVRKKLLRGASFSVASKSKQQILAAACCVALSVSSAYNQPSCIQN